MKGPALFLAQFVSDEAPFNSLGSITRWAAGHGYRGVQIPTWDSRIFDLQKAAESQDYVDEVKGICAGNGVEVTELSTHLQGQLVASHPAYDRLFDGFAPTQLHRNVDARTAWAAEQLMLAAKASRRFGCTSHATFSGALMWHLLYLLSIANSPVTALVAATLWALGVCFMWPTMLAAVSRRFPRGGAWSIGVIGFAGAMATYAVLPEIGKIYDEAKLAKAGGESAFAALQPGPNSARCSPTPLSGAFRSSPSFLRSCSSFSAWYGLQNAGAPRHEEGPKSSGPAGNPDLGAI